MIKEITNSISKNSLALQGFARTLAPCGRIEGWGEGEFRFRPYSKRELARLYFPETKKDETAVANLRNALTRCTALMSELRRTAYTQHSRRFSTRQVRIIVEYLGEP